MTEERTIEDLARTLCAAMGDNPDRPVSMGEPERMRGRPGHYIGNWVRPAWVEYVSAARNLHEPVRMVDEFNHWISDDAVIGYELILQTLAESLKAENPRLNRDYLVKWPGGF